MDNDTFGLSNEIGDALKGLNIASVLDNMPSVTPHFDPMLVEPSVFRQSWHQLIVIGNGFDLECGLASNFSSFIKARTIEFDNLNREQNASGPAFTETIWDAILSSMKDSDWCDIEGAISEWIAPKKGRSKASGSKFAKTLHKLMNPTGTYDTTKAEDTIALFLANHHPYQRQWDSDTLLQITREDLSTLESDFGNYLLNEVKTSRDYKENVRRLMSEVILDQRPSIEDYDVEESILSFNYTRAVKNFRTDEHDIEYVNIHGKLGGEIIFGIDGTNRMDDSTALPFTKTYRLMALDLPDIGKLVQIPSSGAPLAGGTRLIKFYGHSLGEADYSYFQAIFDSVKLYEGDTRLIFYFRPHQLSNGQMQEEGQARKEMMDKVIRLLAAYGLTLDNQDHGKNLIHKLLIEGRLSVRLLRKDIRCDFFM